MNNETLLGNVHYEGIGKISIPKVNTTSQVSGGEHNFRNKALFPVRKAFLILLRANVFGFATLLSRKAFEVSPQVTATQTMGKYWWDVGAKWRNAWFNLGGKWDNFTNAVNVGKNKKFRFLKFAPRKIKEKLKEQGISGFDKGIGAIDPATATVLAAAAGLIAAISPLILGLFESFKKDAPADEYDDFSEDDFFEDAPESGSKMKTAGAGLIGVGILAALYFGTMIKK